MFAQGAKLASCTSACYIQDQAAIQSDAYNSASSVVHAEDPCEDKKEAGKSYMDNNNVPLVTALNTICLIIPISSTNLPHLPSAVHYARTVNAVDSLYEAPVVSYDYC